jgi:hypothetical protein
MRKKHSSIIYLLVIALIVGMFPAAAVAIPMDAQNMAGLGILRGVDAARGVDEAYLAMDTQRYQLVVIMARLMGMEAQLDQTNPNAPSFTDTAGKSEFVRKVMAFAHANPELGFIGYPDGSFRGLEQATAQQIYKVLLVVAGYVENVDFNWGQVFNFAAARGMTQLNGFGAMTKSNMATALTEGPEDKDV